MISHSPSMWEWRGEVNTKHTQCGTATLLSLHSEIKGDKGRYNRERASVFPSQ